jgi:hypothetical protein
VGRSPSYAWRSIVKAKSIVENGVGWQVGNGESIRVWKDDWLPPPQTRLFIPTPLGLDKNMRVSSLIDQASSWWDMQRLRGIFGPSDVERIGKVILSSLRQPDRLVWT